MQERAPSERAWLVVVHLRSWSREGRRVGKGRDIARVRVRGGEPERFVGVDVGLVDLGSGRRGGQRATGRGHCAGQMEVGVEAGARCPGRLRRPEKGRDAPSRVRVMRRKARFPFGSDETLLSRDVVLEIVGGESSQRRSERAVAASADPFISRTYEALIMSRNDLLCSVQGLRLGRACSR